MIGLEVEGRPLLRAYSMASANYEETLEFFSIKVPDGPLTSRLQQHFRRATRSWSAARPPARWCIDNLLPGENAVPAVDRDRARALRQHHQGPGDLRALREGRAGAWLPAGRRTGLRRSRWSRTCAATNTSATWCARSWSTTRRSRASRSSIAAASPTSSSAASCSTTSALAPLDVARDRLMLCGSPAMLADLRGILDGRGFAEGSHNTPGHYVIEKAFVER